ncbi:MAG: anti-sigma factor [Burkholderiales bacterium]
MNLSRPDRTSRLDALAAEYVLGTLPARARMRLARIARTDTVVASTLRAWEQRLSPLASGAPPITPSPRVWRVIALRLGLEPVRTAAPGPWWTRLGFWRGLAAASFAAALVFGVTLLSPRPEVPGQPIVVVMAGPDARPAMIATLSRADRTMTVKNVGAAPVPADKSLELWMLPDGAAPRSLGVLPSTGVGRVTLPALPDVALAGVPALAVSLEQPGGSPTGAPQGPVLYSGKVERFY